jgi:hypothetical protein
MHHGTCVIKKKTQKSDKYVHEEEKPISISTNHSRKLGGGWILEQLRTAPSILRLKRNETKWPHNYSPRLFHT